MSEQLPLPSIPAAVQGPILGPKSHLGPEVDKAVSDAVEGMKRSTAHLNALQHALDLMDEQLSLPVVPGPEVGVKYDSDKPDWFIMPWAALAEVQRVIDFGAIKYTEDNWYKVESRRYFSAAMRHMLAWRAGRDKDDESGLPHLAHAISCLLFILGQELKETQRGNA